MIADIKFAPAQDLRKNPEIVINDKFYLKISKQTAWELSQFMKVEEIRNKWGKK